MKNTRFQDSIFYDAKLKTADIMRSGAYTYLAGELGLLDKNPDEPITVIRSEDEVRKAYARFQELKKIPFLLEHPEEDLDLKQPGSYTQGYGYDPKLIRSADGHLLIRCKVKMEGEALEAYRDEGIKEISCGWSGDYIPADSDVYEYDQMFTDFNHIALVPQGRCGSLCKIRDQKTKGVSMITIKKKKQTVAVQDEAISSQEDPTKYFGALRDALDALPDEHREGAIEALAGLEKFFKAEAEETPMPEEEVTTDGTEEDPVEEPLDADELQEDVGGDFTEDASEEEAGEEESGEEVPPAKKKTAPVKDAALRAKLKLIKDTKTQVITRFHDVLPLIADGIIQMHEIKDGMTPCDIKRLYVKKVAGKDITDSKKLDAYFHRLKGDVINDEFKQVNDAAAVSLQDAAVSAIDSINYSGKEK